MVTGTIQRISAFPDMRHYADEVIWAGNDEQGFVTSHRALNIGNHTGNWRWGPATGKKVNSWVIANCVIGDNEIYEEWVLYNLAAQLQQLGIDVAAAARAHGNAGALVPVSPPRAQRVQRLQGGRSRTLSGPRRTRIQRRPLRSPTVPRHVQPPRSQRDRSGLRAERALVRPHQPDGYGRGEVRSMARSLLSTFPDLGLNVDEVYWMGNDDEGYRVSVRWSALGTHRGWSLYGEPTGRRVHLWGLQQLYIQARPDRRGLDAVQRVRRARPAAQGRPDPTAVVTDTPTRSGLLS